ncbi:MAG: hypothetical protein DUD39_10640 [Coriobacteriaceae bacterium]|nr:MAG: hypothetical protein DUD39_10640 [Coriobacteriaceae bacterium]
MGGISLFARGFISRGGRAYLTVSEEGAARLGEMSPDDKAAISRYDIQNAAPLLVEKYTELAIKAGVKFGQ